MTAVAEARTPAALPRFGTTWVAWRQHRAAILGLAGLLVCYAAGMVVMGLQGRSTYDRVGLKACTSFDSGMCQQLSAQVVDSYPPTLSLIFLLMLPAAYGAFVGGPLVARELETGTFRYAWTQGAGRTRWIVSKLVVLGAVLFAVTCVYGPLYEWATAPLHKVQPPTLNDYLRFEFTGVLFPVHTLLAFTAGAAAGVLTRRTIPAVAIGFGGTFGLMLATVFGLRRFYMTPLSTSQTPEQGAWVVSRTYFDAAGHTVSAADQHMLYIKFLNSLPSPDANIPPGGWRDWLAARHYSIVSSYHPASRFWAFQAIETAWVGVLILALACTTVVLLRRRAS